MKGTLAHSINATNKHLMDKHNPTSITLPKILTVKAAKPDIVHKEHCARQALVHIGPKEPSIQMLPVAKGQSKQECSEKTSPVAIGIEQKPNKCTVDKCYKPVHHRHMLDTETMRKTHRLNPE